MAVLTRSPTNSEFNHHVGNMGTGQSLKDFIAGLLALDEFQAEVAEQGINEVIFDMIKNLLHKIPNADEVASGVEQYNAGNGAEYVISLMNNPSVIDRFQARQESAIRESRACFKNLLEDNRSVLGQFFGSLVGRVFPQRLLFPLLPFLKRVEAPNL